MLLHPDLHEFWECELDSLHLHVNALPPNLSPQPEMGEYLRNIIGKLLLHWLSFCGCVFVFMCEQVLICLCTYACGDLKCLHMYVPRHVKTGVHPWCLFMN